MSRQIYSLQESTSVLQKLHRAGLTQVRDVCRLTADQLVADVRLSPAEAAALLRRAGHRCDVAAASVTSHPASHVVTFSQRLDALLGGGLPLGKLTELVAPPGGGKTQLCLQACVDAALPAELGGLAADSIYVDTEHSLHPARLLSLAEAAAAHCRRVASDEESRRAADRFSAEAALARVRVIRASTADDVLALPPVLSQLMAAGGVRLVVVDSLAAPFRGGGERGQRTRRAAHLQWLAGELRRLARRHAAAVVVTNHVTTALEPGPRLVPALGAGWQHCAAVRVCLEERAGHRVARLLKHPDRPDGTAAFQVLAVGVRDVCDAAAVAAVEDAVDNAVVGPNVETAESGETDEAADAAVESIGGASDADGPVLPVDVSAAGNDIVIQRHSLSESRRSKRTRIV